VIVALVVLACARGAWADDRYPVTGMVLESDPARLRFVASIETIPGFMAAMTMPFTVRKAADLGGLVPGAIVEFTLVVGPTASYAEGIRMPVSECRGIARVRRRPCSKDRWRGRQRG
jgi:Cu/Ag efflux protein CusF